MTTAEAALEGVVARVLADLDRSHSYVTLDADQALVSFDAANDIDARVTVREVVEATLRVA